MSKITRRDVLSGIAGCSLAAILGCEDKHQATTDIVKSGTGTVTKLNVIIHGLAVIKVDSSNAASGITLFMPLVKDPMNTDMSHRYWFGSLVYTKSHELDKMKAIGPKDVCTLGGFNPGSKPSNTTFDPTLNLVFPGASVDSTGCRQFIMPWTDQVQSVAYLHRKDNLKLLTDNNCGTSYGNIFKLSSICVLTYDVKQNDQPQITFDDGSDTGWTLEPGNVKPAPGQPIYGNLHIFAEPRKANAKHAKDGFTTLMTVIGKQQCLSFDDFPDDGTEPTADTPPAPAGTDANFDLLHLGKLLKAGEVANCVRAVVI
jgi:hypothetical protein